MVKNGRKINWFKKKSRIQANLLTDAESITIAMKKEKKYRIRETKHLSTDADCSTDAIGGWTKNTQKPNFFEKRKKSPKT